MAKKISRIETIVMVLLLSLAYACGAGNKRPSDDGEPFDAEHNTHWQDIEKNSVVTTDFEGNVQLLVTAGKRHQIFFPKNTDKKAIEGNFHITDATNNSKAVKIAGDFKHNKDNLLFTAKSDKLGLVFEAIFIPCDNFMRVICKVEDTTGRDRAINVNYALNIDAAGWNWWDDIRSCRKIREEEKEYSNVTNVPVGLTGEMSFYPFSCISSEQQSLSYGIPLSQPRIFKIYYDTASKEYKISFDFALTQKTEKFPGHAIFSFIIYSPDHQWGFRAAAQDYYNIYPDFFEKRIQHEGIWMPFTKINSVENAQDFHFAFHEYGNVDLKYNNIHNIYSFRYLEPWTYWMPMAVDIPRQYEKAMALLKEETVSSDSEKQKISQATILSGIYDEKGNLEHNFLNTPWCNGVVFHNNTDPDIKHTNTLTYNRADICFETAKDEVVERKIVCFDTWEHYVKGYEIDNGSFLSEKKNSLKINRSETVKEYGARQLAVLNQNKPIPLIFGGYSKAEGVTGVKDGDYSIYIDIIYTDNTYSWGHIVSFDTGTHDWQYGQKFIYPDKPVKSAYLHILFRGGHTGIVWFDDVFLKELTPEEAEKVGKQAWDKYVNGFELDNNVKHSGNKSISVTRVGENGFAGGARQEIELNQINLQPVKISAWSKVEGVTGKPDSDYSIYADIIYTDDSPLYGVTANFNVGTTPDWQYKEVILAPQKPIKKIALHLLFRGQHTGKVWFDDISLVETATGKEFITDGGFEKLFFEGSRDFGKNTVNLLQNAEFEKSDENLIVNGIYLDSLEGWAKGKNFCQEHFKYADVPIGFDTFTKKPLILNAFSVYEFTKAMSEYMHKNNRLLMANWVPIDFPFYCHLLDVIGKEVHWVNFQNEYQPDKDSVMNYRRTLSYQKPYLLLLNVHFDRFTAEMTKNYFQKSLFYGMFPSMFSYDAATDPYFDNPKYYNRDRGLFIKYLPLIEKISKAGWEPLTFAKSANENIFVERYGGNYSGTLYFSVHNNLDFNQEGLIRIDKEKLRLTDKFKVIELISNADTDYKEEEKEIIIPVVLSGYQTKVYRLIREDYGALLTVTLEDMNDAAGILDKYLEQQKITPGEEAEYGNITTGLLKGVSNKNLMENAAGIKERLSALIAWAKDKKYNELINQVLKIECDISALTANASNVKFTLKTEDTVCSPSNNKLEMEILNNSNENIILDETILEISPNLKIKEIKHQLDGKAVPRGKSGIITAFFIVATGLEEGMEETVNAKLTFRIGTKRITLTKSVLLSVIKDIELKLEPQTIRTFDNNPEFKIFLRNNSSAQVDGTLSVIVPDNCVASLEKEKIEAGPHSISCITFNILCPLDNKRYNFNFKLVFDDGKEKKSQEGVVSLFPKRESLLLEKGVLVEADSNYAGYNTTPLYDGIIDTEDIIWNESAWASAETATPHWIEITFPEPVEISSVMIHWTLDDNKYWASNKYKIEYLKNDEWVLLDKMEGPNTAEKSNKHIFNRVAAKKVRIWQEVGGGPKERPDLMWIREVEVCR